MISWTSAATARCAHEFPTAGHRAADYEAPAAAILAEIGTDMSRYPSHKHLTSWAGVCPGNKESGGRRPSGKTTKGNVWLRAILGEEGVSLRDPQAAALARWGRDVHALSVGELDMGELDPGSCG